MKGLNHITIKHVNRIKARGEGWGRGKIKISPGLLVPYYLYSIQMPYVSFGSPDVVRLTSIEETRVSSFHDSNIEHLSIILNVQSSPHTIQMGYKS